MKKHHAEQVHIKWVDREAFRLIVEPTSDGERIAQEKRQQEQDRAEAESRQRVLTIEEGK